MLAVVFFFAPIPEVTDADMVAQAETTTDATGCTDRPLPYQYTLFWGVVAQFCYVGSQVAIAGYFINYVTAVKPSLTSAQGVNLLVVA